MFKLSSLSTFARDRSRNYAFNKKKKEEENKRKHLRNEMKETSQKRNGKETQHSFDRFITLACLKTLNYVLKQTRNLPLFVLLVIWIMKRTENVIKFFFSFSTFMCYYILVFVCCSSARGELLRRSSPKENCSMRNGHNLM